MTPAEHYRAAELQLIASDRPPHVRTFEKEHRLAAAQIHITAALVGAIVLAGRRGTSEELELFDAVTT